MSGWVEETANKTGFALNEDEIVSPAIPAWLEMSYDTPPLSTQFGGTGQDFSSSTGIISLTGGVASAGSITASSISDFNTLVDAKIDALKGDAPELLDTLGELSDALGDDANYAATITTALAGKLSLAGGTMIGDIHMDTNGIENVKELIMADGEDGISLDGGGVYFTSFLNESNMASDDPNAICSQESIKAYVDAGDLSLIDEDNMATDSATRPPSQQSVKAYVDGQTHVTELTHLSDVNFDGETLDIPDLEIITATSGDLFLDVTGDILLSAEGRNITMDNGSTITFDFNTHITQLKMMSVADTADYFSIDVDASGVTTLATVDDGDAVGHLNFTIDGDINVKDGSSFRVYKDDNTQFGSLAHTADDFIVYSNGNIVLNTPDKLIEFWENSILSFRHNGSNGSTKFCNDANNYFEIVVTGNGNTTLQTLDAGVDSEGILTIMPDGDLVITPATNSVKFEDTAAGFVRKETVAAPTTQIDFRQGNKHHLDIVIYSGITVQMRFPDTSGNFILVVQQDDPGSRTITTWAAKDSAGNLCNNDGGTAGAVRWAGGGTAPTLSTAANSRDIISLYWDADEEVCYGMPSLDFS